MEILKIKDWLTNKNKQFEIHKSHKDEIIQVYRKKDGRFFTIGESVNPFIINHVFQSSEIEYFNDDCINVKVVGFKILPINHLK